MATWMVVEDEPDLYEMVLSLYELMGVQGEAFTDGEEAVSWIEAVESGDIRGELPELALVDIRLPGQVDGSDVSARLRKSPILGKMAVVLMTAYRLSASEEKKVFKHSGANLLIYKPLPHLDELRPMLENLLT
jgi:CheY-like chemotaxis protein